MYTCLAASQSAEKKSWMSVSNHEGTLTHKKKIKCQPEQTHCRYDSVCLSLHVRGLIYTWA